MEKVHFKLVPVNYSKPYDEQPGCKRHVIGAYANLARHNMTVTINVIMQAIGMDILNENDIHDAFNKKHRKQIAKIDNIQKVNLQKRLYRHFPFFKRMKLEDETKKSVQLNTLLEVMSDFTSCMSMLRNFYTHYHPYNSPEEENNQLELKKTMGRRLQYLYENTSQMFKSNESLDHESNEVLSALRIPEDYTQVIKPEDKEYKKTYDFYFNPTISEKKKRGIKYDPATKTFEKKAVRFVRNPEYQAYMMDEKKGMSDIAIIYFLCLFLEKKVAFDLMNETGFTQQIKFKGEHADRQLLYLKEIMCMNRIRMTKTKLDSEMSDTALALDMINELRKCPKPLYKVFCKETREEFKDDTTVLWEQEHGKEAVVTEELQDNDEEAETESTDKSTPRSTFVRWEDRFPQMALKYIDMTAMFNDIRFQLNLGKYRFAFYTHHAEQSVDNQERLRILQKELHGFGRLLEVDVQKNLKWASLYEKKTIQDGLTIKTPDKDGQAPYVTEQRAQYAIDEKAHSIGMRWEGWNMISESNKHYGDLDKEKMFIPYLPSTPVKGERQTNQSENLLAPQCTLSLYELPGLLFYQHLMTKYKKSKFDAEKIIKDTYSNLQNFFNDVAGSKITPLGGKPIRNIKKEQQLWEQRITELNRILDPYHLTASDIPTKLRDYLCNKAIDYDRKIYYSAINRLKEKKEKVEKAKKDFELKKKKIGSKENKFDKLRASIKTGQLAQWLIRDIFKWLPNNSKSLQKLTGQKYAVLQSALTMLGQNSIDSETPTIGVVDLENIFSEALIIAKDNEIYQPGCHHPFLKDVILSCEVESSIEDLYEKYLEKELEHIDNITDKIVNGDSFDDYYLVPFLHCERQRWEELDADSMRTLAKRYSMRPIQLPNGMFTTPVFNLLMEIENTELHQALMEVQNNEKDILLSQNLAYLLNLYFKFEERDHPQPFYSTEAIEGQPSPYLHVYRVFKKYFGEPIPKSNKTTSPQYTIEEIHGILKEKENIMNLILYNIADDVEKFREEKNRKVKSFNFKKFIDTQWKIVKEENSSGKVRRSFQERQAEVDKRIKAKKEEIEELKKEIEKETEEYKDQLIKKEIRRFKKVSDNERTIRRYKAQDILLLIMAREILKAKSQDEDFINGFNLKYVMENSLLDKPIDFTWDVLIRDKEKGSVKKKIEQKGMKMKNYGQFYKFASDHQRLESLLSRLPQSIFQRAEIENELSYYDTNRSEVFRQVYIIESEAYKLKPGLENDKNANEEWFNYIEKKTGKPRPIRNSFIQLLEILAAGKDGILDESEKTAMQNTRNAFGHNTYDVDLQAVFEGKEGKMKIPEVANGIKDKIEEQTEKLKKRIE